MVERLTFGPDANSSRSSTHPSSRARVVMWYTDVGSIQCSDLETCSNGALKEKTLEIWVHGPASANSDFPTCFQMSCAWWNFGYGPFWARWSRIDNLIQMNCLASCLLIRFWSKSRGIWPEFFFCKRLSASVTRSLHCIEAQSVYRVQLASWTWGESNRGQLSGNLAGGCLHSGCFFSFFNNNTCECNASCVTFDHSWTSPQIRGVGLQHPSPIQSKSSPSGLSNEQEKENRESSSCIPQ